MREMEIFRSSDYLLAHPLYTLLLIFLVLLIFYFNNNFFQIFKVFLSRSLSNELLKLLLFGVAFVFLTIFYIICLDGVQIDFLYSLTYHLRFLLFLFLIANPINDLYEIIFQQSKFQINEDKEKKATTQTSQEKRKGYQSHVFGTIERLAVGFLIIFKAFETIGFILAAKALVRENLIKKDDEFAQIYYVGTLYSLVSVFIIWAICFW